MGGLGKGRSGREAHGSITERGRYLSDCGYAVLLCRSAFDCIRWSVCLCHQFISRVSAEGRHRETGHHQVGTLRPYQGNTLPPFYLLSFPSCSSLYPPRPTLSLPPPSPLPRPLLLPPLLPSFSPPLTFPRGFIYGSYEQEPGWVLWLTTPQGRLLHWKLNGGEQKDKSKEKDQGAEEPALCSLIDQTCLRPSGRVKVVGGPTEPHQTLHVMSDGMLVYWVYALKAQDTAPHPVTGEKIKQYPVFLHTLQIKVQSMPIRCLVYGSPTCD